MVALLRGARLVTLTGPGRRRKSLPTRNRRLSSPKTSGTVSGGCRSWLSAMRSSWNRRSPKWSELARAAGRASPRSHCAALARQLRTPVGARGDLEPARRCRQRQGGRHEPGAARSRCGARVLGSDHGADRGRRVVHRAGRQLRPTFEPTTWWTKSVDVSTGFLWRSSLRRHGSRSLRPEQILERLAHAPAFSDRRTEDAVLVTKPFERPSSAGYELLTSDEKGLFRR